MSIVWDALKRKITWATAATQIEAWGAKLIARDPTATQLVNSAVQIAKQGVSNAIGMADTALADHLGSVMAASHAAADAALLALSGGKAAPAIPLVDGVIDQIEQAGAVALHAWALQAKAGLVPVATASISTQSQPLGTASATMSAGGSAAPANGG